MARKDAAHPPLPAPQCPRCGYDQSGAAAAWTDSCPLRGRCPECGLEYAWSDIMDTHRHDLPWLHEHTPGRWPGCIRALRTWLRCLVPWVFWGSVPLAARVVWWRLLLWVLLVFGSVHAVHGLAGSFATWQALNSNALGVRGPMPWQMRAAAFLDDWATPYASVSWWAGGAWHVDPQWSRWPWTVWLAISPLPLMPAMILLLGTSRAMTKVRFGHVLRAAVLQTAIFVPWYAFYACIAVERAVVGGVRWSRVVASMLHSAAPYMTAASVAWFAAWWYCAIVIGFRLPRGRLVWLLLMVACAIMAVIGATLDSGFGLVLWP